MGEQESPIEKFYFFGELWLCVLSNDVLTKLRKYSFRCKKYATSENIIKLIIFKYSAETWCLGDKGKTYLPPRPSIRSLSLGSSGLWSCVTSTALMNGSVGSSWTPRTTAESPTWATYMRFPRMTTTLAVVPDVLGRPVSVFGHSAEKMKERKLIHI